MKWIPKSARRRIRKRRETLSSNFGWPEIANAFLTSFVAMAMLMVAYAQWRTSERQADNADSLRALEFAKAEAKFQIEPSKELVTYSTGLTDRRFSLPRSIKITPLSGVTELKLIDIPVTVYLTTASQSRPCEIEIRGLYLDDDSNVANLWAASAGNLADFLMQLEAHGLYAVTHDPRARLTYVDLLGNPRVKMFHLNDQEAIGPDPSGVPVYSGAWSGGQGFYLDETDKPEEFCPDSADLLKSAIREAGGKPGPIR
jgi:hypothetical protein